MNIRRYLPSSKLVSIALSLALSVGLVFASDRFAHPAAAPATVTSESTATPAADAGWEAALYAIQAQNASSTFTAADPNLVNNLLQAAQSPNVTETIMNQAIKDDDLEEPA